MSMRSFVLPAGRPALNECLGNLPAGRYRVTVEEYKTKRSLDANAYYWGQVITPMAEHTGYTPEEMHEVLLFQIYGEKTLTGTTGAGRYQIPAKRTNKMTTTEFQDHIHHCQRIAAELGVQIQPEAA